VVLRFGVIFSISSIVVASLAKLETLPPKNRVHPLAGYGKERKGEKFMECHVILNLIQDL